MFQLTFAKKLALTMTVLILVVTVFVGYPLIHRQFAMTEQQFNETGATLAKQAAANATEIVFTKDAFAIERLINNFIELQNVRSVVLINRDLEVFGTESPRPAPDTIQNPEFFELAGNFTDDRNITWFFAPIRFQSVTGGAVWIGLDKNPMLENQQIVITSALIGVALFVLSIIWLAVRLSRTLGKPIQALVDATHAINAGNFSYRIRAKQRGEFAAAAEAFNEMARGLEEKHQLERNFSRFVSPSVADHYKDRNDAEMSMRGELVEASIVFVDLVKYTNFSEHYPPEKVAEVLNCYFSEFAESCHSFQGNVDKYIGDCAMLIFGCPKPDPKHRQHALTCAVDIRTRIDRMNRLRQEQGEPTLSIRIGLTGGTVLAGLLGSPDRLNYSVVGEAANLAARLCDLAPEGEILTDKRFLNAVCEDKLVDTHQTQAIQVKGFRDLVETLVIDSIDPSLNVT